jgi:hypothetical protein
MRDHDGALMPLAALPGAAAWQQDLGAVYPILVQVSQAPARVQHLLGAAAAAAFTPIRSWRALGQIDHMAGRYADEACFAWLATQIGMTAERLWRQETFRV